jgi:NAD+ diphosphatase
MHRESIYKHFIPAAPDSPSNGQPGYWFAFNASSLLVKVDDGSFNVPLLGSLEELHLRPVRTQYLGTLEGVLCHAAELPPDTAAPEGWCFTGLRSFYSGTGEDIFLLAGRALQMMSWDQTHQYCGRCGHRTETVRGEMAKICPVCKFMSYPRISPAVIAAVLKEDRILLTRYASSQGNMRTIIAGFLEPGETLEECVRREVLEEVGLKVKNIRYFGNQPWPFPNSLMIGFTAEWESGEIRVDGKEIAEAEWYRADNTPATPPKMSISGEIIDWFKESHRRTQPVDGQG